jgi:hypothetical protein
MGCGLVFGHGIFLKGFSCEILCCLPLRINFCQVLCAYRGCIRTYKHAICCNIYNFTFHILMHINSIFFFGRILLTNTMRLSWLILPTMRSAMTQGSRGSANRFTSTENFEDSPLLGRNTEVSVERDTGITRHDLREEQLGRGTTLSLFAATVKLQDIFGASFIVLVLSISCKILV